MIETLFIVHTEANLNMICPVNTVRLRNYERTGARFWCRGLAHPPLPIVSSSASTVDMITTL